MNKTGENAGKAVVSFSMPEMEVFASSPDEKPTIRGYAAIFDANSQDLGGFYTRISPGAFDRVLPTADVRLLVNHDRNLLLGRTRSGTLQLSVDSKGLRFQGFPPDTQFAAHYMETIRRGDLTGCSFSCDIDRDEWKLDGDFPVRMVHSISALYDVGPVTDPAFLGTSVSASYALEAARREESERLEAAARRRRHARVLFQRVSLGL